MKKNVFHIYEQKQEANDHRSNVMALQTHVRITTMRL